MNRKLIVGLFALVSLAGSVAAADKNVAFDQRGDIQAMMENIQGGPVEPAPAPQGQDFTFTMSPVRTVYAKGFIKKDLPARYWRSFKNDAVQIPDKLDLRPKLTQVENQGQCGSCWAFSLTATHRDGFALGGRDPGRLSQEWLVDNSTQAEGCNGGYFDSADNFVIPRGQPLWSACPYKSGSGKCAVSLPIAAQIKTWFMLGDKTTGPTVRDIEAYMTAYGKPVSIGLAAGAGSWQSYSGGIYNACVTAEMDHMINIVGWDNEGAAFDNNGNLPPGKGIWIVRNSWGAYWGEKGYMRTKMTDPQGKRCNAVAQEAAAFEF
jgi:C1A family cysteine protease